MNKTDEKLREEFRYLIENYKITDETPEEDIVKILEIILNWLKENTPKKLYRYRNCADYNISGLRNGEIWGSPLLDFNDLQEGIPYFNIDKIEKDFNDTFSESGIEKIVNNIEKSKLNILNRYLKMLSRSNRRNFQNSLRKKLKKKKNFLIELKTNLSLKRKEIIMKPIEYVLRELLIKKFGENSNYRRKIKTSCFTNEYDSETMWGHYTDNYRGFVLEYDFSEVIRNQIIEFKNKKLEFNYLIAPVIYTDRKFDMTEVLLQELVFNMLNSSLYNLEIKKGLTYFDIDKLLDMKVIFNKSNKWNDEKEWRLIINSKNYQKDGQPELLLKCKPTKVYLGIRMTEENKKEIIQICKESNIEYENIRMKNLRDNHIFKNYQDFKNKFGVKDNI